MTNVGMRSTRPTSRAMSLSRAPSQERAARALLLAGAVATASALRAAARGSVPKASTPRPVANEIAAIIKKANRHPCTAPIMAPPTDVAKKPPAMEPREDVRNRKPKARPRDAAG